MAPLNQADADTGCSQGIGNSDVASATHLLSVLRSTGTQTSSLPDRIDKFTRSPTGRLWWNYSLRREEAPRLGEYGYMENVGIMEQFVCLGHLGNCLELYTSIDKVFHRNVNRGITKTYLKVHEWPDGIFKWVARSELYS